jgi:homogentisate 1,2-dioxygenase
MNVHSAPVSTEAVVSPKDGSTAYMVGFANSFATESMPGALPIGRV